MIDISRINRLHPNIIFRVNTNLLYYPLKKIIRFILTGAFSIICSHLLAQQNVSGVVLDDDNIPLAGATVNIPGSNKLTLTSADGTFSIAASPGEVLEISFAEFKTQQIKLNGETTLKIILQRAIVSLDDVVMTGYTSQKIKEITGSVAVVKSKDLTAVPAGQIEQMLQGRVAGLNIITSGMPGGGSKNSFTASTAGTASLYATMPAGDDVGTWFSWELPGL